MWKCKKGYRSWQDSNLQSPDPKSGALSIRPHDPSYLTIPNSTESLWDVSNVIATIQCQDGIECGGVWSVQYITILAGMLWSSLTAQLSALTNILHHCSIPEYSVDGNTNILILITTPGCHIFWHIITFPDTPPPPLESI